MTRDEPKMILNQRMITNTRDCVITQHQHPKKKKKLPNTKTHSTAAAGKTSVSGGGEDVSQRRTEATERRGGENVSQRRTEATERRGGRRTEATWRWGGERTLVFLLLFGGSFSNRACVYCSAVGCGCYSGFGCYTMKKKKKRTFQLLVFLL